MFVKPEYREIASAKINKNTNVVISECSRGGYTMAKQIRVVDENDPNKTQTVFMRGGFHFSDSADLYALQRALDEVLEYDASKNENADDWGNE